MVIETMRAENINPRQARQTAPRHALAGMVACASVVCCNAAMAQAGPTLLDGFEDEAGQVVFGQPVLQRRGQEVGALAVKWDKAAHAVAMRDGVAQLSRIAGVSPTGC